MVTATVSPSIHVRKRSGVIADFQHNKIVQAVRLCLVNSCRRNDDDVTKEMAERVGKQVSKLLSRMPGPVHVEAIQDLVEQALMAIGEHVAARQYIIYREEHRKLREAADLDPKVAAAITADLKHFSNDLQVFQHYDKYSRFNATAGRRETYTESVTGRVMPYMQKHLNTIERNVLSAEEWATLERSLLDAQAAPSMRLLQIAGPAAERCQSGIYNCSFAGVSDTEYFAEMLYTSMQGCGQAFSVESEHIEKLPQVKSRRNSTPDVHRIPDTTEGWCDSVKFGMERMFDGHDVKFIYDDLRPAGSTLKTKGGTASGPAPLHNVHDVMRRIIFNRENRRLRDIDAHDILCHIGMAGQLGGHRRAAMLSMSDLDSADMRLAKFGQYWVDPSKLQRSVANNSTAYDEKPEFEAFMTEWVSLARSKSGERGIFNRGSLMTHQFPLRRREANAGRNILWGTNPCFAAGTMVHTRSGHRPIEQLVGEIVEIWDGSEWRTIRNFRVTAQHADIVAVQMRDGTVMRCTPFHTFIMEHGQKIYASSLQPGDRLAAARVPALVAAGVNEHDPCDDLASDRFVVASVSQAGIADAVYCCSVEDTHRFALSNGILVGNCGEVILDPAGQFCVAGDTHLITRDGVVKIADVVGATIEIWNGKRWSTVTPVRTGRDTQLLRVLLSDGSYLDTTSYHGFSVSNTRTRYDGRGFTRKSAHELMSSVDCGWGLEATTIEHAAGLDVPVAVAYETGVAVGDGCRRRSNDRVIVDLYGVKRDLPVRGVLGKPYVQRSGTVSKQRVQLEADIDIELVEAVKTDVDAVNQLFSWSRASILAFIAGWLDTDGSETGTGGVRLYLAGFDRARRVQLLLTKCGIRSSACLMAEKGSTTNYGVRNDDMCYLQITDCAEIPCHRLNTSRGHQPTMKGKYQVVHSVTPLPGRHDVFCFEEPETHKAVFGNALTYQCNLSISIIRPNDDVPTLKRKVELATIFGTIQSTMTRFNYLRPRWKENCERERLLGVDLLGALDNPLLRNEGRNELLQMLRAHAVDTNAVWAKRLGINASNAVTVIKPGGNSTVRWNTGQSMSGWLTRYNLRNVEVGNHQVMCRFLKDSGVPNQPSYRDPTTTVFTFPFAAPEGAFVVADLNTDSAGNVIGIAPRRTAIDQLEDWLAFKMNWTEHNPSVSIYVADDEWFAVGDWVWKHWDQVGGLAFFPLDGGIYRQAPITPVTEKQYDDFVAKFPVIAWEKLPRYDGGRDNTSVLKELACAGGACNIN